MSGGHIYFFMYTNAVVKYSNFTNGVAMISGGSILSRAYSVVFIEFCNFCNNRAYENGGDICLDSSVLYIINSNFINSTAIRGAAIYTRSSIASLDFLSISNCTSLESASIFYEIGYLLTPVDFFKNPIAAVFNLTNSVFEYNVHSR